MGDSQLSIPASLPDLLDLLDTLAVNGCQDGLCLLFSRTMGDRGVEAHVIATTDEKTRASLVEAYLSIMPRAAVMQQFCIVFCIRYFLAHGGQLPRQLLQYSSLADRSICFLETMHAPDFDYTIRDVCRLAAFWKLLHPVAVEGGFPNYRRILKATGSPRCMTLWYRWFAALASSEPDVTELAKQVRACARV